MIALSHAVTGQGIHSKVDVVAAAGDIATSIFHPVGTCKMGKPEVRERSNALYNFLRITNATTT